MLTHENIMWTSKVTLNFVNITERDQWLSYLPLSHIAEQLITIMGSLLSGGCVHFVENFEKLGDNLREVRPNFFFGVPRVWEKIQEKMVAAGAENPAVRKLIIKGAKKVGLFSGYAEQRGEKKPLLYCVADRIIFNKVKDKLGLDRARMCLTAAAPIGRDTLEFFLSLGIPIYELFGMSETTGPGTLSLPHRYKTGTCGFPLPGTDVKIAQDGEILLKGPHIFKGYYKNEKATKEALDDDGWLRSGDIGEIDEEGYLKITDRKKDIIITAGGKNIAPQVIEGKLKSIPMIEHAVVIGDQKKYLSALITLNEETLSDLAKTLGVELKDMASMAESDKVKSYIADQIELVNETLSKVEGIKKFTILGNGFTIDTGELTPTMKVKRKFVYGKYSKEIDGLY
jgi:long-subunit acyl-CoA synthetase (AMP-forming)